MAVELEVRPRVRLPDALPEQTVPHAARGHTRALILAGSMAAYAAIVALGLARTQRALRHTREPQPAESNALSHPAPETSSLAAASRAVATSSSGPRARVPAPDRADTAVPSARARRALPTCEDVLARRHQLSSSVTSLPRNMTGSAYGALLDGTGAIELLRHCTPGTWRRVDLCVAVEGVTAVGVTVRTTPADDSVERCMSNAIADLSFSHQDNLQVFRTGVTVTPKRR